MLFVVLMAMTATHAVATAPAPGSSAAQTVAVSSLDAGLQALELPDQFGVGHRLHPTERSRASLLLLVEVGRLRRIKGFESDLRARVATLDVVRVAHVPSQPRATLARVAQHLRAHVPAEVPVLIDIEGRVAAGLRVDPAEVNAWVLAPDGRVRAYERGRRTPAVIARLAAALASPSVPAHPEHP